MLKKMLTIALLLPTPSYAACHRYHTWHYHFPQSCRSIRYTAMFVPKIHQTMPVARQEDHSWYVQIDKMPFVIPPLTDDQAHSLGIEMLKHKLGGS